MQAQRLVELWQDLANRKFVFDHIKEDVTKLLLKYSSDDTKRELIAQIAARQRVQKKLPEWSKNQKLLFPPTLNLEQSSSEAVAQLKSTLVNGKSLIDLTGGFGVDIYYLSKSFDKATYIERNPDLAELVRHNFLQLGSTITVINKDALKVAEEFKADVVYIDPARRDGQNNKMVSFIDCEPDVVEIKKELLRAGKTVLIKASPMLDINLAIDQLKNVSQIWVISVKNECKELVFNLSDKHTSTQVHCFNTLDDGCISQEVFKYEKRHLKNPELGEPQDYLYEPNSSILKSGGNDLISLKYGLKKLHPNSQIYTSSHLIETYPGKVFRVNRQLKPYDKVLKKGRFNVISRNFRDKAHIISQKLNIKPAKNDYIIATQLSNGNYSFLDCLLVNP